MEQLNNIEIFNGVVGKIFANLYANFPTYSFIETSKYATELVHEDDSDGFWDVDEIATAALKWLVCANYIWLDENQPLSDEYSKGVLSPKGLEVLKAFPDSINSGETIGDKLVECSKGTFNSGLNEVVTQAVSMGFKLITGS